jgi:hypothetical protein
MLPLMVMSYGHYTPAIGGLTRALVGGRFGVAGTSI